MDYQQFLFTITAGLQSACQAEKKITVQTIEQKHTAKIKNGVIIPQRKKNNSLDIYGAVLPFISAWLFYGKYSKGIKKRA